MDTKELDNLIRSKMTVLADEKGFKIRTSREGGGLKKKTEYVVMDCGYAKYSWVDEHSLSGFYAAVGYPVLEKLVTPILVNSNLLGSDALKICNTYSISNAAVKNCFEYPHKILMTEESLLPFITTFKLFLIEDAFPFFEQFSNLNKFYNFIKNETHIEKVWTILGRPYELKLATLYRLCNDNSYESIIDEFIEQISTDLRRDSSEINHHRYLKASLELKKVLDRTAPIYNV
jgi:hypothetical protein